MDVEGMVSRQFSSRTALVRIRAAAVTALAYHCTTVKPLYVMTGAGSGFGCVRPRGAPKGLPPRGRIALACFFHGFCTVAADEV